MPGGGNQFAFNCQHLIFWNYNSNITAYRLDEDQVDSLIMELKPVLSAVKQALSSKCTLKT
jgi:hypothetical protein